LKRSTTSGGVKHKAGGQKVIKMEEPSKIQKRKEGGKEKKVKAGKLLTGA